MTKFSEEVCWKPIELERTIYSDIGAMPEGDNALFLATHVSMPLHKEKPSSATVTETDLLEAVNAGLAAQTSTNRVIAIVGPSGSGKTHLVRWIEANLDHAAEDHRSVYVPRRVTGLREITRILLEQMGGDRAHELLRRLDAAAEEDAVEGRVERLLNRIWENLKFGDPSSTRQFVDVLLPDNGGQRGGLATLLGRDAIRAELLKPTGAVQAIVEEVWSEAGADGEESDKRDASFTADDLDLSRVAGWADLPRDATTALQVLSSEPARQAAADLLNDVRDRSIQELIGLGKGESLRDVFNEARRELAGKRLVLLFEDLALMKFVQGAILDEFANHGDDHHASLVVVFAITDDKYAQLAETIEGRVTHRFRIEASPLADERGAPIEGTGDQFVARYLNAARVGRTGLVAAAAQGERIPNHCEQCEYRDTCHEAFGEIEVSGIGKVGLYPLNRDALSSGFRRQDADRRAVQRSLTARVVVESLVLAMLRLASVDLNQSRFPGHELAELLLDRSLSFAPREVVPDESFAEGSDAFNRLFNVRAIWFRRAIETEGVRDAFALPLAAGTPATPGSGPVAPPVNPPATVGPETPGPQPAAVDWIQAWSARNEPDSNDGRLRQLLRKQVEGRLDLGRFLVHASGPVGSGLAKSILGDGSFVIAQQPKRESRQLQFVVERNDEGRRFLLAAQWLDEHGHWDFDQGTWTMPVSDRVEQLPIEFETRMTRWVKEVEGSYVGAIFDCGTDPVAVAATCRGLAQEVGAGASWPVRPSEWVQVLGAGERALSSPASLEAIAGLAGARQSDGSLPAAIDTTRTAILGGLPATTGGLAEHFPRLAVDWRDLETAISAAIAPMTTRMAVASRGIREALGDHDPAELGSRLKQTLDSALAAGVALDGLSIADYQGCVTRITSADPGLRAWADAVPSEGSEELDALLPHLGAAPEAFQLEADLMAVGEALDTLRRNVDARIASEGGEVSVGHIRKSAVDTVERARSALLSFGAEQ